MEATARAALTRGTPSGVRSAVATTMSFTDLAAAPRSRRRATTPLRNGVAIDVPDNVPYSFVAGRPSSVLRLMVTS
jgi:hypothetical protein